MRRNGWLSQIIKLGDRLSQATLEFAIVLVLLFLLIMGIVVFGRLFGFLQVVNNAAREGARVGAVCKSDEEVIAVVKQRLARIPGSDQAQIIISPAGTRVAGEPISVTVRIPFKALWLPGVVNQPLWLTVKQTMTMECSRIW
ncbi:MAG: pilus assembly protein [Armatimonadota bacterium]|nr:pilus assembly protein [Armatimonadota bacterium]MCX7777673.1 pilus assembly protein [Armatimonadota bacterium]MDW8025432.1 pilus assembly protein [Armatimonadota bacterium]